MKPWCTLLLASSLAVAAPAGSPDLPQLARAALAGDGAAARALRAAGPSGLSALLAEADARAKHSADAAAIIDRVAAMHDASACGLYWYADLDAAKRAAADANRPILSLRLLGRLDEEYSCANSRFFRVLLYPDPAIATLLRDRFVLHWQSVRPAPKLTIDFGDGRTLTRTITGNSIHYVLAPDGTVLDALPGLLAPDVFRDELQRAGNLHRALSAMPEPARAARLREYQTTRLDELAGRWQRELSAARLAAAESAAGAAQQRAADPAPPALAAANLALSKRAVERPVLASIATRLEQLDAATDAEMWRRIGAGFEPAVSFSPPSLTLVRAKLCGDQSYERVRENLRRTVAADTAWNLFVAKRRILARLADPAATEDDLRVDALNAWIYAEIFQTPDNDPWLGLRAADTFSALTSDGVARAAMTARLGAN